MNKMIIFWIVSTLSLSTVCRADNLCRNGTLPKDDGICGCFELSDAEIPFFIYTGSGSILNYKSYWCRTFSEFKPRIQIFKRVPKKHILLGPTKINPIGPYRDKNIFYELKITQQNDVVLNQKQKLAEFIIPLLESDPSSVIRPNVLYDVSFRISCEETGETSKWSDPLSLDLAGDAEEFKRHWSVNTESTVTPSFQKSEKFLERLLPHKVKGILGAILRGGC